MIPKEARRCITDDCGASDVNNCKEDVIVIRIAVAQIPSASTYHHHPAHVDHNEPLPAQERQHMMGGGWCPPSSPLQDHPLLSCISL